MYNDVCACVHVYCLYYTCFPVQHSYMTQADLHFTPVSWLTLNGFASHVASKALLVHYCSAPVFVKLVCRYCIILYLSICILSLAAILYLCLFQGQVAGVVLLLASFIDPWYSVFKSQTLDIQLINSQTQFLFSLSNHRPLIFNLLNHRPLMQLIRSRTFDIQPIKSQTFDIRPIKSQTLDIQPIKYFVGNQCKRLLYLSWAQVITIKYKHTLVIP